MVGDHVHLDGRWEGGGGGPGSQALDVLLHSRVHVLLDVALESSSKVFEHSRSTAQHNVLVEAPPDINGALHNRLVDDVRQRGDKIGRENLDLVGPSGKN